MDRSETAIIEPENRTEILKKTKRVPQEKEWCAYTTCVCVHLIPADMIYRFREVWVFNQHHPLMKLTVLPGVNHVKRGA